MTLKFPAAVLTVLCFLQEATSFRSAISDLNTMFFTEIMGDKWGQIVNILVLVHVAAVAFWVWGTYKEVQKDRKQR